jgi:tripeptide aminopeptidase
MREKVEPVMHIVTLVEEAMKEVGVTPKVQPIRGGTDGARLSFMGLPCPNLGTGGYAFHGPFEHITAEGMDAVVAMLHELVSRYK